jgi:hypothetical protein
MLHKSAPKIFFMVSRKARKVRKVFYYKSLIFALLASSREILLFGVYSTINVYIKRISTIFYLKMLN